VADVRKALRALAERALRKTPRPDDGPSSERLSDALEALRLLLDHWDELFLPGALSHASALTPLTPMPRREGPRSASPRSGSPSSAGLGRPEEMTLLALFAERGVKVHSAIDPAAHARACRKCLRPFVRGDDVLVYVQPGRSARDQVTTHLKCRWWWWESPQSPIRPTTP
jgi:hypothetical protein